MRPRQLRGLRRGEAAALDRDLDSKARELTISRQLVALPGELYCGPPKSRASYRTIAMDEVGTRSLATHPPRTASCINPAASGAVTPDHHRADQTC
jgi:hypothetical protein